MKVFEVYKPILNYGPEELEVLATQLQEVFGIKSDSTRLRWGANPRLSSYRASGVTAEALNDRIEDIREAAASGRSGRTTQPHMRLWGFDLPIQRDGLRHASLGARIELAEKIGESGKGSSTNQRLLDAIVEASRGIVRSTERGAFRADTKNLERRTMNNLVLVGLGNTAETVTRSDLARVSRDESVDIPRILLGPVEVSFCDTEDPGELLTHYGYLS